MLTLVSSHVVLVRLRHLRPRRLYRPHHHRLWRQLRRHLRPRPERHSDPADFLRLVQAVPGSLEGWGGDYGKWNGIRDCEHLFDAGSLHWAVGRLSEPWASLGDARTDCLLSDCALPDSLDWTDSCHGFGISDCRLALLDSNSLSLVRSPKIQKKYKEANAEKDAKAAALLAAQPTPEQLEAQKQAIATQYAVPLTTMAAGTKLTAKFDYAATRPDELELKAGDAITLVDQGKQGTPVGWWTGTNARTGKTGLL